MPCLRIQARPFRPRAFRNAPWTRSPRMRSLGTKCRWIQSGRRIPSSASGRRRRRSLRDSRISTRTASAGGPGGSVNTRAPGDPFRRCGCKSPSWPTAICQSAAASDPGGAAPAGAGGGPAARRFCGVQRVRGALCLPNPRDRRRSEQKSFFTFVHGSPSLLNGCLLTITGFSLPH